MSKKKFPFDENDLEANRDGYLSDTQLAWFKKMVINPPFNVFKVGLIACMFYTVTLFFIVSAILTDRASPFMDILIIDIIVTVVWRVASSPHRHRVAAIRADVRDGEVDAVYDEISFEPIVLARRRLSDPTMQFISFDADMYRIQITPDDYRHLRKRYGDDGYQLYSVYFLPRSQIFVSLEPVSMDADYWFEDNEEQESPSDIADKQQPDGIAR